MFEIERIRRRRRCCRLLSIAIAITFILALTSWCIIDAPDEEYKPSEREIIIAKMDYMANGNNGYARIFLEKWPEYEYLITGE